MELKFRCSHCNRKLEADATLAGSVLSCPSCNQDVTVPPVHLGRDVTLGGFRIERLLGRGAMGEVFLANQLSMNRLVALKVLPGRLVSDSDFVERFFQETRLAAKLQHPNIVAAYDAGMDHGYYYFAMAYVEGEALEQRLKRQGALSEREALAIATDVADALAYAWDHGRIMHRDIKPSNIMLSASGNAMIMDMGIAKSVADESHLTATGVAVGTPHYMSPEQARGVHGLDFATDMYALGATLFHLIAGRVPFVGNSPMEVVAKHMHDPLPAIRRIKPEVSQACEELIGRMMAKNRKDRYPSWQACIKDIHAVLRGRLPDTAKEKVARQASEHLAQQRQADSISGTGRILLRIVPLPWIIAAVSAGIALAAIAVAIAGRSGSGDTPGTPREGRGAAPHQPRLRAESGADQEPLPLEGTIRTAAASNTTPAPAEAAAAAPASAAHQPAPAETPPQPAPLPSADPPPPRPVVPAVKAVPLNALDLLLDRVAVDLVAGRLAAAVQSWEHGRQALAGKVPPEGVAAASAAIQFVADWERQVLGSFRSQIEREIILRLRDRTSRVTVLAMTSTGVRVLEHFQQGAMGKTITCRDLSLEERSTRVGPADGPHGPLARGLLALWDERPDTAQAEFSRCSTPTVAAVQRRLAALAAERLDQVAHETFAQQALQLLNGSMPTEDADLRTAMRRALQTPAARQSFTTWLREYEHAHAQSQAARNRVAFLRDVLLYPFPGADWTVPEHGIAFVWIEKMGMWVGKYEITNAQFRRFFAEHDSGTQYGHSLNGDHHPAVSVSYDEAEAYADFISEQETGRARLPGGFRYRLPSKEEWTVLAGCDDGRRYPWGNDWPPPPEMNYPGTEWPGPAEGCIPKRTDPFPVTCPVTESGPNAWGLHGVGGNACEWTSGSKGGHPELRGGGWMNPGASAPTSSSLSIAAALPQSRTSFRGAHTGLRLVLAPTPKPAVQ